MSRSVQRLSLRLAAILLAGFPAHAATAGGDTAAFDWFEYRGSDPDGAVAGPGDYRNPILGGFYPDPSITRVGDDYYLVNSTFAWFPGIPVFHSRDLVNWTQIGNAIDRPDQLDFARLGLSRGVFAPAIEHHRGTFYILNTCVDCGGNFLITATDPAGPWSDPVWLPDLEGGIDPSLFFDDDGRAWILNNGPPKGEPRYDGHRAIWIQEFDPAAKRTIGPRTLLVDGGVDPATKPIWIEGPHIFKKDGFYYLIAAEGGTAEGHSQVALRADKPTGPYAPNPANPILTQRDLPRDRPHPITSAGHADFVETAAGEWWATFLAVRPYAGDMYNSGRETFLLPVRWEDGWPRITDPGQTIPYVHPRPKLPVQAAPAVPTSGPFTVRDEFEGSELPPYWMMLRNPREQWFDLASQPGKLVLKARPQGLGDSANPSFLARRQQHMNASATTAMRYSPERAGDEAGLVAFQSDDFWYFLGAGIEDGRPVVKVERRAGPGDPAGGVLLASAPLPTSGESPLFLRIEAAGPRIDFAFGTDGRNWQPLLEDADGTILSTKVAGGFVGAVFGVHARSGPATAEPPSPIRLNQIGFQPGSAKRAILPNASTTPLPWTLIDGDGATVARGMTMVAGDDPASGEHVHTIDFGDYSTAGRGFRLTAAGASSRPFAIDAGTYDRLHHDALAYFYHNRAGTPIDARFAGERWARPAGHPKEVAACFSGADIHGNRWPGCDYRLDVTGGWYDAGDHGKYVVNGGIALWTLLNLHERQRLREVPSPFRDGAAAIPEAGNGVDDLLDEARWEMAFLLSMQVPRGESAHVPVGRRTADTPFALTRIDASGMAHHKVADERWTSLPMAPHRDPERRLLYPPSTAATLNLAATAAQCARIWRAIDPAFSARCLEAAERAFAAAARNPNIYAADDFTGSGAYGDTDVSDEFYWAAAELFLTTGGKAYEAVLRRSPHFAVARASEPSWPQVATLGTISLALLGSALPEQERLRAALIAGADGFVEETASVGYRIPFASLRYVWGSNGVLLNRAIILAYAHDFTGDARYRGAVTDVVDYLLGRNPLDRSFVSGHGARPMENPHHRFWARSLDPSLPPPPPGALSGGPNSTNMSDAVASAMRGKCAPQACWVDDIDAFSLNEVAINWNAPLVWVAAYIDESR